MTTDLQPTDLAGADAPTTDIRPTGVPVRIAGLSKDFGSTEVLTDLHLDIAPGEFVVLLGPSGSGKSTLARCLAGVERVSAGELSIDGQLVDDGARQVPPERRNLAMVFQDYALWPHMTVSQNVAYALRRHRLAGPERAARTQQALELVGLPTLGDRYPGQLSGGQQQRVALARAVVGRPGLLLFDEPLSNLDADLRERLRVEIATLTHRFGITTVYITHDQAEAFALADRVGVLQAGRLVQVGAPEDVYHRPASPFVARFTGVSCEWPGQVVEVAAQTCVVDVQGQRLRCTPRGPVAVGAGVTVLVRPHCATLEAGRDTSAVDGVVTDVAFRGRGYDHVVSTSLGEISGVHGSLARARQERVQVHLDPTGCHAFPDDI